MIVALGKHDAVSKGLVQSREMVTVEPTVVTTPTHKCHTRDNIEIMIREDNLAIQERRCELNADKNLGIFFDVGSGSDA